MDFNSNSLFNLSKVSEDKINKNVSQLLIKGEEVIGVYKTVRDQVVFTDRRIVTVDVEGMTGVKQHIFVIPYKKIQYFSMETQGFMELLPDSKLTVYFSNGVMVSFDFKGNNDLLEIGRAISEHTLR